MKFNPHSFDEFLQFAADPAVLEPFRDSYGVFMNTHKQIKTFSVGFHFGLYDDDEVKETMQLLSAVSPSILYAGTKELQRKLSDMGYASMHVPFYEEGCFAVVLSLPIQMCN